MVAEYDDGGQIGRRYRRQDEIGTPWALTIDEQTLEDETVTDPRPRLARAGADLDRRARASICSTVSPRRGARLRTPADRARRLRLLVLIQHERCLRRLSALPAHGVRKRGRGYTHRRR